MHHKLTAIFLALIVLTGCIGRRPHLQEGGTLAPGDYDVALAVKPLQVKFLEGGANIDAVEKSPDNPLLTKVVVFSVERVLRGEFIETTGAASKFEQAKEAAADKNILKLITMDFENPDEVVEKKWVSVAVESVVDSFGITDWENPEPRTYTLYLKKLPKSPGYIYLGNKA